jgi:outer membrane protein assembly factor BamB
MPRIAVAVLVSLSFVAVQAADWPRFRGPANNGISEEKNWLGEWPGGQPKQVWKKNVGVGFSSMAVAGGRIFTMGHDGRKKGEDRIVCLDAETGNELWRHAYPQGLLDRYYEGGSSGTPTVDGGRVYTLSKFGNAFCLDAETGKVIWTRDLGGALGLEVPEWGFAGAPLIEGDLVIYNAGTAGVALNKATGADAWISGKEAAGYGSPVAFTHGGRKAVALFAMKDLIAVEPATGKELWRFPWKTKYDVNAADPAMAGDMVFISSGYGKGGAALKLGDGAPKQLWFSDDVRAHMTSPIIIDGHVYVVDGNGDDDGSRLKCVELATGKLKWESPATKTGVLTASDGKLIWVNGTGELRVVEASPAGYKELARAQVIGGKIWAAPVLANGRLYVRNWKGDVVSLDLKPAKVG